MGVSAMGYSDMGVRRRIVRVMVVAMDIVRVTGHDKRMTSGPSGMSDISPTDHPSILARRPKTAHAASTHAPTVTRQADSTVCMPMTDHDK